MIDTDILAGSHIPILLKAIENSDGPILEMGSGAWSTPILNMMVNVRQKREILTLENDRKWFEKNRKEYESDFHKFLFVEDWDKAPIYDTFWGLVLVDHRPARQRHRDIIRLKHQAYMVLAHDTEPEINQFYRFDRCDKHYRFKLVYDDIKPNTTVYSNFSEMIEMGNQ